MTCSLKRLQVNSVIATGRCRSLFISCAPHRAQPSASLYSPGPTVPQMQGEAPVYVSAVRGSFNDKKPLEPVALYILSTLHCRNCQGRVR